VEKGDRVVVVTTGTNWQEHMTLEKMLEFSVCSKFSISGRIGLYIALFGIQVGCELLRRGYTFLAWILCVKDFFTRAQHLFFPMDFTVCNFTWEFEWILW